MAVREILLLGNERLYAISKEFKESDKDKIIQVYEDLKDTMIEFRRLYGFGRAIAAPQIDEAYRMIYMNVEGKETVFVNPVIQFPDEEQFELWDDCMSFPGLEVRLVRHKRCRVIYKDLKWNECVLEFEGDLSELFQHEYDHLDGILSVQRAVDLKAFRVNKEKQQCF